MFIVLTQPVDFLRLGPRAPAGMVAAVGDDLGAELVANGQAVALTLAEFQEGLLTPPNAVPNSVQNTESTPMGDFAVLQGTLCEILIPVH